MMKRMISWLLCLAMLISAAPVSVFAQETEPAEAPAVSEVISEETAAAPEATEAAAEVTEAASEETEAVPEVTESAPEATEAVPQVTESAPEATEAIPEETQTAVLEETGLEAAAEDLEFSEDEDLEDTEEENGILDSGESGGLHWEVTEDGILTISGSGAMADFTEEEMAPWYDYSGAVETLVVEKGVTSIGDYAFYEFSSVLTMDLPDSLTAIGDYGFAYCYGLTEVTLPKNILSLGQGAFYNCYDLTKISFPKSLQSIGAEAFCECEYLETLSFPDKLKSIGDNAFAQCYGLTKVTFGSGLETIGDQAFLECECLTGVSFPGSLRSIGQEAFSACISLTKATFAEGVQTIGYGAFLDCGALTKVALPGSLKTLGDAAFSGCYSLTSAVLKNGLEYIGEEAFLYCELLTSITIPKSVKTIGRAAFAECIGITSLTLQEGLETIGEEAFAYCYSLKSVKFPKSLTTLEAGAFSGCEMLTKATFTKDQVFIGEGAFDGCYDLTMTVPHGSQAEWYAENNGIIYTHSDKCAHSSIGHMEPKEADCDTVGNYEYWYCAKCGTIWEDDEQQWLSSLESVTIPSPHEIMYMDYMEPDCETPGNLEYWYCELCQRVWLDEALTRLSDLSQVVLEADHVLTHFQATPVSCQEDGNLEHWYCEYCGGCWLDEALTQSTDPETVLLIASHDLVHVPEKEPTCQESGNLEYWTCRRCGECWQDADLNQSTDPEDVLLPQSHELEYRQEQEADCDQEGRLEHWHCGLCGGYWLDEELSQTTTQDKVILGAQHALTHVEAQAPTCEADGNPEYWYCEKCEAYWLDKALTEPAEEEDLVLPGGHAPEHREAKEATCQAQGCIEHWYCAQCGGYWLDEALTRSAKEADVILPKAHKLTHTEAKEATCQEDGSLEYWHCQICQGYWLDEALTQETDRKTVTLSGGHILHNVKAREATCDQPGCLEHWYCQRCNVYWLDKALTKVTDQETVTLVAAHAPVGVEARESTCQVEGCKAHWACENCDKLWLDEALTQEAAREEIYLGFAHILTHTPAKEPTCQDGGNLEYWTCQVCAQLWLDEGLTQSTTLSQVLLSAGHKTVHVPLLAPTMTEGGNLEHWYCEICRGYWLDAALTRPTDPESVLLPSYSEAPDSAFVSGTCGDNVLWTLYLLDGTLSLAGSGPMADYTATQGAPWLEYKDQITGITVSQGITRVGSYAFRGCTALERLELPQTLTSIGEYAFTGCASLETVDLPQGLTTIGNSAFRSCGVLSSVTVPQSVTKLGTRVFSFCSKLVLTVWPDSRAEKYATEYALDYEYVRPQICDHRDAIHVPAKEPTYSESGNLEHWVCDACGKLFLDAALTQEGTWEQVVLPSMEAQDSRCGENAYWTYDPAGIVTILGTGEMYDFSQSESAPWQPLADTIREVRVEKGITSIGARSFRDCTNLTTLTLPDGILEIRDSAFRGTGLQAVKLPRTVKTVASHAFRDCAALAEVALPEGLRTLGTKAFAGCTALKALELPESLSQISADVFAGCDLYLTVAPNSLAEKYATGYAIPYGYGQALPQAQTISLMGPGGQDVTGKSLSVDMFENQELWLFPVLGPEGSSGKVNWKTSSTSVATVKDGLVTLKKPGTVTITASLAGKRVSASVALVVSYLDQAQVLTARAEVPEMGLEQYQSVTMEVFGKDGRRLSPDTLRFWTSKEEIATVDEAGVITAEGKSGTVTVTAAIVDDPLNRRVSVKLKVIPAQVYKLTLDVEGAQVTQQSDGTYRVVLDQGKLPQDLTILPRALDRSGNELPLTSKSLKWSASNPKVASVSSGKVKLKNQEGSSTITAQVNDLLKCKTSLTIQVINYAPKLEKTSLELNKNLVSGTGVALTASGGNDIQAVSVHEYDNWHSGYKESLSDKVAVDWTDGLLTLKPMKELSTGSMKLLLKAYCENGSIYDYYLKLSVVDKMPGVTVKALEKFNLFYTDSTAMYQITAKDAMVEDVELSFGETPSFAGSYDPETGLLEIAYSREYLEGEAELLTKGVLLVSLAGYSKPVEKSITISTEKVAPKLTLSADSSLINTALGTEMTTEFYIAPYSPTMEISVAADFALAEVEENSIRLTLVGITGGKAEIYVNDDSWTDAICLTHTVKVTTKKPTMTLGAKKVKLWSWQSITLNQNNAVIDDIILEPTSKSAKVLAEAEKLQFEYELYGDLAWIWVAGDENDLPKKGTYEFRVTLILENGQKLSTKTFKVSVS